MLYRQSEQTARLLICLKVLRNLRALQFRGQVSLRLKEHRCRSRRLSLIAIHSTEIKVTAIIICLASSKRWFVFCHCMRNIGNGGLSIAYFCAGRVRARRNQMDADQLLQQQDCLWTDWEQESSRNNEHHWWCLRDDARRHWRSGQWHDAGIIL